MVVQDFEPGRNLMTLTNLIGNFRGRDLNKDARPRNGNLGAMPFQPPSDINGGDCPESSEPPRNVAKALLICRPNSHPFQERTLVLNQGVKIGRSVAKARPAAHNAIFDCKVLSRNHALMWYENGKFYLQDVKSSNGTFVNNQRLSKGSEESAPREICSGDIVQFGVDVVENTKKVTHGCIIATVKLFLPDGKEAKASSSTAVVSSFAGNVSVQDMHQLHHCIQDALRREEQLQEKLGVLQNLLYCTNSSTQKSWKALIDEDRLLTRVEILESQLQVYSKNFSEDKLREELKKCHADKETYQNTAKETLCNALKEKGELSAKLKETERRATAHTDDLNYYKNLIERRDLEMDALSQSFEKEVQSKLELDARIKDLEAKAKELEQLEAKQNHPGEGEESESDERVPQQNGVVENIEALKAAVVVESSVVDAANPEEPTDHANLLSVSLDSSLGSSMDSLNTAVGDVTMDHSWVNGFGGETSSVGVQVDHMIETIEGSMEAGLRSALRQTEDDLHELKERLRKTNEDFVDVMAEKTKLEDLYKAVLAESGERLSKIQYLADENARLLGQADYYEAQMKTYEDKIIALEMDRENGFVASGDGGAASEDMRNLLADAREARKKVEAEHLELKAKFEQQVAENSSFEKERSALLAEIATLTTENNRLIETESQANFELSRAREALNESEKEAASYKDQFLEKSRIADEAQVLLGRIRVLEDELSGYKRVKPNSPSVSPVISSSDDAYASLQSPRKLESDSIVDSSVEMFSTPLSPSFGSASFDVSLSDELNASKLKLLQAKESYMKYHRLAVELKRDNDSLRKELKHVMNQTTLASMKFKAVIVLVFGIFVGMAIESYYSTY